MEVEAKNQNDFTHGRAQNRGYLDRDGNGSSRTRRNQCRLSSKFHVSVVDKSNPAISFGTDVTSAGTAFVSGV